MKLSQKETCGNCRALNNTISPSCELGFQIQRESVLRTIPLEPCYKPLTLAEWLRAREIVAMENNGRETIRK